MNRVAIGLTTLGVALVLGVYFSYPIIKNAEIEKEQNIFAASFFEKGQELLMRGEPGEKIAEKSIERLVGSGGVTREEFDTWKVTSAAKPIGDREVDMTITFGAPVAETLTKRVSSKVD